MKLTHRRVFLFLFLVALRFLARTRKREQFPFGPKRRRFDFPRETVADPLASFSGRVFARLGFNFGLRSLDSDLTHASDFRRRRLLTHRGRRRFVPADEERARAGPSFASPSAPAVAVALQEPHERRRILLDLTRTRNGSPGNHHRLFSLACVSISPPTEFSFVLSALGDFFPFLFLLFST